MQATEAPPRYSSGYKGVVLGLLLVTYTFNFIDRTIIGTIGQAVKVDLQLTDTQLGLLGGLSFAILYTLLGIPIARLAERRSRVSIIAASLVIWSGFTAACGLAQNFVQLLAMRVGVGVGEAGCSPPAHSLISDYFPPEKRATALSIYSFGIPLGTMIGAVAGGWLTDSFSWRTALVVVGLPGILIALAVKMAIREPQRGGADAVAPPSRPPTTLAGEFGEISAVCRVLFRRWGSANIVIGMTLTSFATYGTSQFAAPYFIRVFSLSYTEVGLVTGLTGGLSAGAGTLLGGYLSDRLARRSVRWYALAPAIGLLIAAPIYMAAYVQDSWQAAALVLLVPGVFAYTCLGPTYAVVQNVVQVRQRATATALLLFVINLIALGFGPPFTGWLIDTIAQASFVQPGALDFATACPGGVAPKTAGADVAARCARALNSGTRYGLIATYGFHLWAALHYYLASFGLERELRADA